MNQLLVSDDYTKSFNEYNLKLLSSSSSLFGLYKKSALDFTANDKIILERSILDFVFQLRKENLNISGIINVAKTNGKELLGECYTRGNTIYFNESHLNKEFLSHYFAHEVYHIISRYVGMDEFYFQKGFKLHSKGLFFENQLLNPDCLKNYSYSIDNLDYVKYFIYNEGLDAKSNIPELDEKFNKLWKSEYNYQPEEICAEEFTIHLNSPNKSPELFNFLRAKIIKIG
jgi:hypothetical protein